MWYIGQGTEGEETKFVWGNRINAALIWFFWRVPYAHVYCSFGHLPSAWRGVNSDPTPLLTRNPPSGNTWTGVFKERSKQTTWVEINRRLFIRIQQAHPFVSDLFMLRVIRPCAVNFVVSSLLNVRNTDRTRHKLS
ncbi:hypothetical protein RRG08_054621 [Elysia crispata]|uniref:Uncharacterized protein n=1 Tax=Elysia crispata TaxID=231223 RepID=A0AAE1E995_9GAST|nr:hypothetical protein RRG08_054621 [Elysia crispata]